MGNLVLIIQAAIHDKHFKSEKKIFNDSKVTLHCGVKCYVLYFVYTLVPCLSCDFEGKES